jgi:hypothetical protein
MSDDKKSGWSMADCWKFLFVVIVPAVFAIFKGCS